MTENICSNLVKDILLLYELSMSIGKSVNLQDNCKEFLKVLLSRKNYAFGAIWIKNEWLIGPPTQGISLVYAEPLSRADKKYLPAIHPLMKELRKKDYYLISSKDRSFRDYIFERNVDKGLFLIFRLGDLGFLKLYTPFQNRQIQEVEINQLREVIKKFSVSIIGNLDHLRLQKEIEERKRIELELKEHKDNLERLIEIRTKELVKTNLNLRNEIDKRIKIEKSLRKSEERFRKLIELSPNGILVVTEDMRIRIASPAAAKLLLAPDEKAILGKKIDRFISEKYLMHCNKCLENIAKNPSHVERTEVYMKTLNGKTFPAEIDAGYIEWDGKPAVQIIVRDITQRKQMEKAILESEAKFKNLAEQSPNMIFINKNGRIVYANRKCKEIMGYNREEFYSADFNFLQLIAPESRDVVRENFQRHLNGENVPPYEYTLITRNGEKIVGIHTTKLIDYEGEKAILGIITDITQRKATERALQESERKYRKFFEDDITGDFISTPDGEIKFCNPAFARILGFNSVEEVLSQPATQFYPNRESRQKFINLLCEKKKLERYEEELININGEKLYVISNTIGEFDDEGNLIEIRGYMFDITEQKKLEEQIIQTQKMEAIGQLTGGIAHDFNNLLTVINGYSQIILNKIPSDNPLRNQLEQIMEAGKRAEMMTSQLLAFSRKESFEPAVVNLNVIIKNMEKLLTRLIGENILIKTILSPELKNIKIDPTKIEQVIMNLAVNARDAMLDGGQLTIETKNIYLDSDQIKYNKDLKAGEYVELTVKDTGIGMDKETLKRIFEPFFTTKKRGHGTGLGLSTVYGIIKQSKGIIDVDSELNKGTVFRIYFPALKKSNEEKEETSSLENIKFFSGTILLAEDDELVRELITNTLSDVGYKVLVASTGFEAINKFKKYGKKINLLITDIMLPDISGYEIEKEIKRLSSDVKTIFMSGYPNSFILEKNNQDITFLQKPFTPDSLFKAISKLMKDDGKLLVKN